MIPDEKKKNEWHKKKTTGKSEEMEKNKEPENKWFKIILRQKRNLS